MIARLDLAAIHDLREALRRFARVPLAHLHFESRAASGLLPHESNCAEFGETQSSIAFVSTASGTINGFIVYNDSPWDSEIAGRRMETAGAYRCRSG